MNIVRNIEDYRMILDNLPFSITIQNLNYQIIYENRKAIETFGKKLHTTCWKRWQGLDGYGNAPCSDCVFSIVKKFKESHATFRPIIIEDETKLLKLEHIPLQDEKGEIYAFIELIQDITDYVYEPLEFANIFNALEKIKFIFAKVGDKGAEIITGDKLKIVNVEDEEQFIEKLIVYLLSGVLQNWRANTGLYGPLPVLDQPKLVSFVYPFKIKDPNSTDPRKRGLEAVMLIIIVNRNYGVLFNKRAAIDKWISNEISKLLTIENITDELKTSFGEKMKEMLYKLNVD